MHYKDDNMQNIAKLSLQQLFVNSYYTGQPVNWHPQLRTRGFC